MGIVLTIASQKGGVGKTTTAVNLAFSLSLAGRRTLLFDLDPQGNGSSGLGISRETVPEDGKSNEKGYLSRALADKPLKPFVRATQFDNLSLLPSSAELSDLALIQEIQGRGIESFRRQVKKLGSDFDFVLVDCPPSLGGLPTVALAASDQVLIPVQCEYYAMEGLSQILPVITYVTKEINSSLYISGLLLTMFTDELELSHDVVREITEYFPDTVFDTIIPRDVILAEAASHGLPAFQYAPFSRGAWSYIELAKEIMENG